MEIVAPKEWDVALSLLESEKGVAIILGGTDTGKSTLARFLISRLAENGRRPALVDADIGQSFLGPPTTIGLRLFDSPPDWEADLSPELFFVGSTSPEGNLSLHLGGTKRMVDRALSYGAGVVVVDTTGLVSGELGKTLKKRKIELLSPRLILSLQRFEEIEHILGLFEDNPLCKILRIPVSKGVRPRSPEERKTYRERKYESYFKDSRKRRITLDAITLEGKTVDTNGFSIPVERALRTKRLLTGLNTQARDTLALGIIEKYDEENRALRILTPLKSLRRVRSLHLSSLKLTPGFEEERV